MSDPLVINSAELESLFKELVCAVNRFSNTASNISSSNSYNQDSLIFLQDKQAIERIATEPPAILVTTKTIADDLSNKISQQSSILSSANVGLAHALIKQHYADYPAHDKEWGKQHSSAVIHETSYIAENCHIGANVVIGANVRIGKNTVIRSGCVIERDAIIGANCIIHSGANIGLATIIGDRVIIRPNVVIGNEGFGLSPDADGRFHRIPHSGSVIIEDDVQVGSCCNIDRGTYGETRIGRGTKMDAQCHIAHNVEIGEDCILTAQCVIAGSSKIGNRVMMSGKSGISDHVNICDDVTLLHRASVFTDITKKGKWAGTPALPFRDYISDLSARRKIDTLQKQIKKLEQSKSTEDAD